jgi:hypothetical protein
MRNFVVLRDNLTVWFTEKQWLHGTHLPPESVAVRQSIHHFAIETALALRLVFHQPLRSSCDRPPRRPIPIIQPWAAVVPAWQPNQDWPGAMGRCIFWSMALD